MKNLMFINSICTNFLEFIKPWFVSLNINWIEIILPGVFTLLGAGLGAFLAGKYAVNAVSNQLNYDKNNKRIDILDNSLKISERFSTLLRLTLKHINEFENEFLSGKKEKAYTNQKDLIYEIENLHSYIQRNHKEMSELPIHDLPYMNYMLYRGLLYDIKSMNELCKIILSINKISNINEVTEKILEEELKEYYLKFIEQKNILQETSDEIYKQHIISKIEHDKIEEKIKNLN